MNPYQERVAAALREGSYSWLFGAAFVQLGTALDAMPDGFARRQVQEFMDALATEGWARG